MLNEYFASVYTRENRENLPSLEFKYGGRQQAGDHS